MTLEWQETDPDGTAASDALAIIASTSLPLVSASPTAVTLNGALPDGLRLPAPLRVVISHAEDSFAFRLTAIRELPQEYQACVTLKYLEDLGVGEIAQTLQVPVGTVKTWLFRAREILVSKLKPYVETLL